MVGCAVARAGRAVNAGVGAVDMPRMVRVRQAFERPRVADVSAAVRTALEGLDLGRDIRPAQSVAVTAGSRGIANRVDILRAVVQFLRALEALPFLVPAMGSHGGGTAEGQRRVLESLGITEESVGAPIRSSMEVMSLGETDAGYPVVMDKHAALADHLAVVARVRPHTGFHGPIESGLLKMTVMGLGKHEGARLYHRLTMDEPWDRVVRSVSRRVCERGRVAFGVAVVENAYEETARVEAVRPPDFEATEEELLAFARRIMGRLPAAQVDLLIIDEIGKDVSGTGMDTNVLGRKHPPGEGPDDQPAVRHIFVRGLTERTHGNATGIGRADFTTARLVRAIDYAATVTNCLAAGDVEGAALPIHFETDREAVGAALSVIGSRSREDARVVHIRNTQHLEEVEVSEACAREGRRLTEWEILGEPRPMSFDDEGNLRPI